MTIPIKIECGCGQRYAFDAEPIGGQLTNAVACPSCGADGTAMANAMIAQSVGAEMAGVSSAGTGLRLTISASPAEPATTVQPSRPARRMPGQVEPEQARHEARAKMLWGDAPEEVLKYLRIQGFSQEEASALVRELSQERIATLRQNGMGKIFTGIGLICVPIISLIIFWIIGVIPLKIFALTVMVGLWGAWLVFKGIFMIAAPKLEQGDASV